MTPRELEVELPGLESFVRMARLVVAGFATAAAEIDEARLGGLRMAVVEVCQMALRSRQDTMGDVPLRLRARFDGGRLHVWVEDPVGRIDGDRLLLADVLVSELEVSPGSGGGSVTHLVLDTEAADRVE